MARFDNPNVLAVNERTLANRWATLQRRSNSIWTFSASGDVSDNMDWSFLCLAADDHCIMQLAMRFGSPVMAAQLTARRANRE